MNTSPLHSDYPSSMPTLQDNFRRAIDGTVPPLFVDYSNKRVLIGATTASGSSVLQVLSGDMAVIGTGTTNGYVFPDGTKQTTAAKLTPVISNPYYAWASLGGF